MSTKMVSIARDDLKIAQPAIHFIDELLRDSYGIRLKVRMYFNFRARGDSARHRPAGYLLKSLCLACAWHCLPPA